MLDPTEDEIAFLRKLEKLGAPLLLQGNMGLLKIDRLIPVYVTQESTGADTAIFTLTDNGRRLLQAIDQSDANLSSEG
jgi:hypothetical protein